MIHSGPGGKGVLAALALSVPQKMFYTNIEGKAAVPLPEWHGEGIEGLD